MAQGKSAREFAIDLGKFGELTRRQATNVFRKIAIDLDTRVVLATPVDTGRARGNWFPSLNSPSKNVDQSSFDASGSQAISAATDVAKSAKLGDTIWLTNNLPYILRLENGYSQQAPAGMVDAALNAVAAAYGGGGRK